DEDGSLPGWTPTRPMPAKLMAHAAAESGGRVYVTGGIVRNVGASPAVYSAAFNADGTLGEWRAETPLPARLFSHKSIARNGRLIVFGGSEDLTLYPAGQPAGAISAKVLSAAINPDGTLGAWQELAPLPEPMMLHAAAATSNSVYVFGGFNGGVSNAVYFAPFQADGTIGAWQALHALPKNLLSLAALATEEYVYTLGGGLSYIEQPQADIFYSKIKAEPKAFVKLSPTSINKSANGKWVTAVVGLPEADISMVLPETIRITAINGEAITPINPDPKWTTRVYTGDAEGMDGLAGVTYAMVKFERKAVAAVIPEGEFSAKIEGKLSDGREFSGESMNRALTKQARFAYELQERAGERVGPGGVKVNLPRGSFKGNPELLLTAAPEEEAAVPKAEKEKRDNGMKARGMTAAGRAFEFGPHGMQFGAPVTISLPYDKSAAYPGRALAVGYWNADKGEWELLASSVDEGNGLVSAETGHFSIYQVMAASPADVPLPDSALSFGEVYAFPNPAVNRRPVIHAEVPSGDGMTIKVYTASGRVADEGRVSGAPGQVDDGAGPESAYEYEVREKLQAGVYYFTVEVSKGSQKITKTGKFAVLR
ncbi:MAG: T9SS type A sorting domain-containing protein, partial [Elusimicrobiales bacterium]|nr:T9SS type A sorting domain-containing protein [Elusimicrobiales bacterium]